MSRFSILGSLMVLMLPPSALAQPAASAPAAADIEGIEPVAGGLTAEATAQRALAGSSDLKAKRAELAAANAKIDQTTIGFFPQLVVRGSYTRLSPIDPLPIDTMGMGMFEFKTFENAYAVGAGLTIPLSDYALRLSDAAASAKASRRAAELALEAERARVDTDARVLYYNWLRAHGQVFVAKKALERSQARLSDVKAAFDVGTVAQADVMRIEALVANSQLALEQALALRQLTQAQLAIVMADMGPADYRIGEGVPLPAAEAQVGADPHALLAEAWGNRLELKALDATVGALESGESAARTAAYPRLDAVGDANYANPNQRYFPQRQEWNASWSLGVVASWNVGETFLSGARGDELAAQAQSARSQRIRMQAVIAQQVVSAALDLRTAQAALVASETTVRAAEEAYRVTADRLQVGRATTTDVVIAETDLLGARQSRVNARIDSAVAVLRLRNALGRGGDAGPRR